MSLNDSERLEQIGRQLDELHALVQVLKSSLTPPVGPVEALAPLVASIETTLRTARDLAANG